MINKTRYLALDVFRGATVCLMIVVNTPGEWGVQYGPLQHASWHGFTLTDLVFPSFLFAVGNAMAFVMDRFAEQGDAAFWRKVLKRTFLIFLIGFLLNWFPFYDFESGSFYSLSTTRIPGVLQRIAICYALTVTLVHYASRQIVVIVSVVLLLGYWAILYFCGGDDPYSLMGFVGNPIDHALIGANHLYTGEGVPFDPEGMLSTLPAIVNVVLGYFTGSLLRSLGNNYESIAKLMIAGVALVVIGLWWDLFFPINKKIWTSSFVLLTSGIDMMALAALVYVIEVKKMKGGTYFFEVFGRNPLIIYAFSGVLITLFHLIKIKNVSIAAIAYQSMTSFLPPAHASFLFATGFMLINWCMGYLMDKNKIYIKV
ncbi:heparan-alpha-glucosaminide N-acetyltransferase domain-containing protein [Reichenbachiella agarivorans]|uniref:Heparan-alpha-glucosaminide N-acetyltransferase domain-containing protein n=1 Tax=Reichenbachiella agarivorans TaxID=2979464 RepID=A0ABY6CTL6_9BACT|nr:heparan-alpha-glucosaminide N-acetyltransferase domain-containing protein [Reichenbachiella agarivorans]UXP33862.1 heparan-alpha-glucosaminide N-acetyltransferase domain-containing protein [Reichenbachiella agarivorans]